MRKKLSEPDRDSKGGPLDTKETSQVTTLTVSRQNTLQCELQDANYVLHSVPQNQGGRETWSWNNKLFMEKTAEENGGQREGRKNNYRVWLRRMRWRSRGDIWGRKSIGTVVPRMSFMGARKVFTWLYPLPNIQISISYTVTTPVKPRTQGKRQKEKRVGSVGGPGKQTVSLRRMEGNSVGQCRTGAHPLTWPERYL